MSLEKYVLSISHFGKDEPPRVIGDLLESPQTLEDVLLKPIFQPLNIGSPTPLPSQDFKHLPFGRLTHPDVDDSPSPQPVKAALGDDHFKLLSDSPETHRLRVGYESHWNGKLLASLRKRLQPMAKVSQYSKALSASHIALAAWKILEQKYGYSTSVPPQPKLVLQSAILTILAPLATTLFYSEAFAPSCIPAGRRLTWDVARPIGHDTTVLELNGLGVGMKFLPDMGSVRNLVEAMAVGAVRTKTEPSDEVASYRRDVNRMQYDLGKEILHDMQIHHWRRLILVSPTEYAVCRLGALNKLVVGGWVSAERYVHSDLPLLGAMVEHMFLSKLSDSEHDELFIIKRTPEAALLASDHPALYAALQANPPRAVLLDSSAFHDLPKGSHKLRTVQALKALSQEEFELNLPASKVDETESASDPVVLRLLRSIGKGHTCEVYTAELSSAPSLPLVAKVTVPKSLISDGRKAPSSIVDRRRTCVVKEAELYLSTLHSLQGKAVPRFIGLYKSKPTSDTEVLISLMEDVGDPIGDEGDLPWCEVPSQDLNAISDVYRDLHGLEVTHNSFYMRNILRHPESGAIKLVDFERVVVRDEWQLASEREMVCKRARIDC